MKAYAVVIKHNNKCHIYGVYLNRNKAVKHRKYVMENTLKDSVVTLEECKLFDNLIGEI
jgi:hypothetical protein